MPAKSNITKHHTKQAIDLVMDHYKAALLLDYDYNQEEATELFELSKIHAIVTCKAICDQFLLAPNMLFWKYVIEAIKQLEAKDIHA